MFENVDEIQADGEKPVKYYYNREERVARAPENVKKYYRGEMKPVKGFRALVNGPNKYILFGLVFFVGFTWIYSGFNKTRNYSKVQGVDCEVVSYAFEDQVYSSVSFKWNPKTPDKEKTHTDIKARVYMIDADNQVVNKEIQTTSLEASDNDVKYIRVKNTDFDIIRCDVILDLNGTEQELSTAVKR